MSARKDVIEIIRDLKPWPDGDGNETLSGAHSLDIRDKHQILIVAPDILQIDAADFAKLGYPFSSNPAGKTIAIPHAQNDPRWTLTDVNFGNRKQRRAVKTREEEAKVETALIVIFGQGQPFELNPVETILRNIVSEVEIAIKRIINAHLS